MRQNLDRHRRRPQQYERQGNVARAGERFPWTGELRPT